MRKASDLHAKGKLWASEYSGRDFAEAREKRAIVLALVSKRATNSIAKEWDVKYNKGN